MRILVGGEVFGKIRDAFKGSGHDAWSCDLNPTRVPGQHIQGNLLNVMMWGCWDMFIFHGDCQYLSNSGAKHLYIEPDRWRNMHLGAKYFKALWNAPIKKKCGELPVIHKHAARQIGIKWTQTIQPWQFGNPESKRTCLWLEGLPPLRHTKIVPKEDRKDSTHRMAPGPERAILRAETFNEIADAMADQWG
jgi:hypothetical protein